MSEALENPLDDLFFPELLARAADNMREYDVLKAERDALAAQSRHAQEKLEWMNLDVAPDDQPEEFVREIVRAYIADKRAEPLEMAMSERSHAFDWQPLYGYVGMKVVVASLHPDGPKLGSSKLDERGEAQGCGKWYTQRSGKIKEISLEPQYGGYVTIVGPVSGKLYTADPLILRGEGYQPAFSITPV